MNCDKMVILVEKMRCMYMSRRDVQVFDTDRMIWKYRPTSTDKKIFGQLKFFEDTDMHMEVMFNHYPKGFTTYMHTHPCGHGLFILQGQMKINSQYYGPNTLIWFPEGCVAEHGATPFEDVKALLITNKAFSVHYCKDEQERKELDQGIEPIVSDVDRIEWFYRMASTSGKLFGKKALHKDEDTGMEVNYMCYPAGFTTESHAHPCGQGFFILQGQFMSNGEVYGPNTLLWYPEGCVAEHGATAYEDCICLQFSNKEQKMIYQRKEYQK